MRANWFEWRHATLDDREACRALIQQGSKSFYAASLLLPSDMRMPTYAVYAFCRTVDDIADSELALKKKIIILMIGRKKLKIFIKV